MVRNITMMEVAYFSNVVASKVLRYLSMISDKKLQRGSAVCNESGYKLILHVQVYHNKNTQEHFTTLINMQLTSSTDGPPVVISSNLRTKSVS